MANILDRYGIKEVADVTFYELSKAGVPTKPVLFLDTLKVSTIEQTAESTDAKGGKGNTALISWDYGKEINVTLEDALFSAKSMAIMFGNGSVKNYSGAGAYIMKTETFQAEANSQSTPVAGTSSNGWNCKYEGPDGKLYAKLNPKFYDAAGANITSMVKDDTYFCTFDIAVEGSVIEVSSNSFPGTYYVTGDTYARNAASGADEFFQFIIAKAKVQSQNTITLQADGDPSTFNMSLKVLRPADGVMMRLVKYDGVNGQDPAAESTSADLVHNHVLNVANSELSATSVSMKYNSTTGEDVVVINPSGVVTAQVQSGGKATVTVTDNKINIKPNAASAEDTATVTVSVGGTSLGTIAVSFTA